MRFRDDKEEIFQRIWSHYLPFTIIDTGTWHQFGLPRVPSGRLDYALMVPCNELVGDGEARNLYIDKRDIGVFVARIVKDQRTVNERVVCWSEELTQNEVVRLVEERSGEKVKVVNVSLEHDVNACCV